MRSWRDLNSLQNLIHALLIKSQLPIALHEGTSAGLQETQPPPSPPPPLTSPRIPRGFVFTLPIQCSSFCFQIPLESLNPLKYTCPSNTALRSFFFFSFFLHWFNLKSLENDSLFFLSLSLFSSLSFFLRFSPQSFLVLIPLPRSFNSVNLLFPLPSFRL